MSSKIEPYNQPTEKSNNPDLDEVTLIAITNLIRPTRSFRRWTIRS
jgi:hypothetical protein